VVVRCGSSSARDKCNSRRTDSRSDYEGALGLFLTFSSCPQPSYASQNYDIEAQTRSCIENVKTILEGCGSSMEKVSLSLSLSLCLSLSLSVSISLSSLSLSSLCLSLSHTHSVPLVSVSLPQVIDVQCFLVDMDRDFQTFNKVYAEYFKEVNATRTTIAIRALPTPIAVELKVIAVP
jgi:enamine deaminase RidA (YjgF/YER057c/UK114 family)